MLLDLFREGFTAETVIELGMYIIVILISLSVHELAHGYVAYRCGDATARNLGRLTLNPLAHLDPLGTIMMLVFGFGYAKPVPVNSRNFNHFKRDICFVSLAGPVSNLILSFIGMLVFMLSFLFVPDTIPGQYWMLFCQYFYIANASLAVFNLLPIPPLDGSRILSAVLPGKIAYYYLKYEQYIMIAVFALLYLNVLDGLLSTLVGWILKGIMWLCGLICDPIYRLVLR